MISSTRICLACKYRKSCLFLSECFALPISAFSYNAARKGNVSDQASMLSAHNHQFEKDSQENTTHDTNVDHNGDTGHTKRQFTENEKEIAKLHEEACEVRL